MHEFLSSGWSIFVAFVVCPGLGCFFGWRIGKRMVRCLVAVFEPGPGRV